MNVPILSKRRAARETAIENAAITKAAAAVQEALAWGGASKAYGNAGLGSVGFGGGSAAMLAAQANNPSQAHPGTSWSNQNSMQNALIARVTQNLASGFERAPEDLELALAQQGLSWGAPFPPGRPLDPFYGYRRPPRTYDYNVGENVQLTPRQNRIPFGTIKAIWEAYDVAQICTRHLINDVRSLDYAWEPLPGIKSDVTEDIEKAREFFDMPDKRQPFRAWLAEYLQDVIKYDAGALYIRTTMDGTPLALEVVSGATIIPLVDFYGRRPEDEDDGEDIEGMFEGTVTPAYVQIVKGLPWDWLAADDMIYQPWNPEPDSQYGRAPLEAVLLSANTDIRFQWHFLQYFTEGTLPAGFMEAPPDLSDPAQVAHWQEVWDAVMMGDQSKKTQIRWVPGGSKFTPLKDDPFSEQFVLYLMRRTCAAHGITPADLGFTENVNKSSGDTQIDVQFRVGTAPLLRHCEDVINLFTTQHLKLRCRIKFDDGRETEDRVATATAMGIYIDHGVISPDEPRQELGYPVDKSKPIGRFINNTRAGPIPLSALESMSGEIDEETFAPKELISTPYSAPPGPIPAQGTPEAIAAAEHSAQVGRDLVAATTGKPATADDGTPIAPPSPGQDGAPPTAKPGATATPEKGAAASGEAAKEQAVNPTTITGGTDGITVATSPQGIDVLDDDDDDEDAIKEAYTAVALKRWKSNARSRLRKGQAPRKFVDPNLPSDVFDEVWSKLAKASTREEVDAAFADAGKPSAGDRPAFHSQAEAIVTHYTPKIQVALGKLFSSSAIDEAIRAAYATKENVEKGLRSGMVSLDLPQGIVDSEEDPHITIVFLGSSIDSDKFEAVCNLAREVATGMAPLKGTIGGRGTFPPSPASDNKTPVFAIPKVKGLDELRAAFEKFNASEHTDYKPHVTLRYVAEGEALPDPVPSTPVTFDALSVHCGGAVVRFPFGGGPPPNLRRATNALRHCRNCCLFAHKDCVKYGNWPVKPEQTCDGWELAIDDQPVSKDISDAVLAARAAAAKVLTAKAVNTNEALQVLEALYGDSFLQGMHDAAAAAGGKITPLVSSMPENYWSAWQPGYGDAAARAADGGMRDMLDQADITIKGMTDSSIDRIGNTIADGLSKGDSYEATGKSVREMVGDVNRSEMIANTEYARANTVSSMATYQTLGVGQKRFMAEGDACPECQENEDAGDIPLDEEFPNGDVPVHPNCRCAIAPVSEVSPEGEGAAPEGGDELTPEDAANSIVEGAEGLDKDEAAVALEAGKIPDTLTQHLGEDGKLSATREELHKEIMHEFLDGHASQDNPKALFTAGGPASGKTALIDKLDKPDDAVQVDPDLVRTKLPEYKLLQDAKRSDIAAAATHEEASALAKEITATALERKNNVIIDGVGNSGQGKFTGKIKAAVDAGYDTEVREAHVPVETAIEREKLRAIRTKREVPEKLLRAKHAGVSKTYKEVVQLKPVKVSVYDTSVPKGTTPELISTKPAGSDSLEVLNHEAQQAFEDKANG